MKRSFFVLTYAAQFAYFCSMEHIKQIWKRPRDLAADLGLPYTTVYSWMTRGRVPADRDLDLVEAAKRRGKRLTLEQLASDRRRPSQPESAA